MKRLALFAILACTVISCGAGAPDLTVFLCPSFDYDETTAFLIDNTCVPLQRYTPNACYNTGYPISPGEHLIAHCRHCPDDCGNLTAFATAPDPGRPTVYGHVFFFDGVSCDTPSDCP